MIKWHKVLQAGFLATHWPSLVKQLDICSKVSKSLPMHMSQTQLSSEES